MGILSFIGDLFKPAAKLVDDVHTSDEERLKLRNELAKIESEITLKYMDLQGKLAEIQAQLAEAQAKVAIAETTSESWFVRHYRPIIITSMFAMIVCESFGFLKTDLPEVFWQIFAAAFGVMSVAPSIATAGTNIVKELFKRKN